MRHWVVLAALAALLGGCGEPASRRAVVYGSEILVYEGDRDTLANACHAAIYRVAEQIGQREGFKSPAPVHTVGRSFSQTGRPTTYRTVMTCGDDYRLEIIRTEGEPTYVLVESPEGNTELMNGLTESLANFSVQME